MFHALTLRHRTLDPLPVKHSPCKRRNERFAPSAYVMGARMLHHTENFVTYAVRPAIQSQRVRVKGRMKCDTLRCMLIDAQIADVELPRYPHVSLPTDAASSIVISSSGLTMFSATAAASAVAAAPVAVAVEYS